MEKLFLTNEQISRRACLTATNIRIITRDKKCYPIPRGGIPAAYRIAAYMDIVFVDSPEEADFFIDDLIDSGKTEEHYVTKYGKPFFALYNKRLDVGLPWLVFPWEGDSVSSLKDNITRILQFIGEDVHREGLKETPERVARAYETWFGGYGVDCKKLLKVFSDGAENYDEMVVVKDIPFYSHCEHHIAPFFGTATVAYIPDNQIVGLSKIARLVDVFARRLQVQERLTNQIVDTIEKELKPIGVACVVKARHLCMESRGVQKQGETTITSAVRGVFKTKPEARAEFMQLTKKD